MYHKPANKKVLNVDKFWNTGKLVEEFFLAVFPSQKHQFKQLSMHKNNFKRALDNQLRNYGDYM